MEYEIAQFKNISTSNNAASDSTRLNSAKSNSATFKATILNIRASLIKEELFGQLRNIAVGIKCY